MKRPFSRTDRARHSRKGKGDPKSESVRSVIRSLGLKSLRLKMGVYVVLSLVAAVSQAVLLLVISEVALADVQGKHAFHGFGPTLTPRTALYVLLVVFPLFFIVGIACTLVSTSISTEALVKTRTRLVDGYFKSNWSLQSGERLGHLQHLLIQNSSAAGGVIGSITTFVQSLMMVFALLAVAVAVDPAAAIAVVIIGTLLLQVMRPLRTRAKRMQKELSRQTRAMATRVTEYSRLARDFRLFGVEDRILNMLHGMIDDSGAIYRRASINGSIAPTIYQTFSLGIVVAIVLIGSGHAGFAKNGFVLILVMRGLGYGAGLQGSIQSLRGSQGMLEDLMFDVRRYDAARIVTGGPVPDTFDVDFNAVDYSYDGLKLALHGTTMHIPAGKIVGMLGPSGSGKTTISQLLLGLREPSSGKATMGGVDSAAISKSDHHNIVALVPQEPVLLQGSIKENINFFRDFDEEDVIEASKRAHLHEDVTRMAEGYETFVGEGGGALSGGQKQRLAIARALIGTPKLIVLDEPTSAVDGRTEKLIRQTLSELRGDVTVVIISHRIETTSQCDMLLVLSEGKIADFGDREAVLAGPAYQSIVLTRNDFAVDPKATPSRPNRLAPVIPARG